MPVDSVMRFDGTVQDYVKYRPTYPDRLFQYLRSRTQTVQNVCELGAGTGIFTRQLAAAGIGSMILAVEPNDKMRAAAEVETSSGTPIQYLKGTAESIPFPENHADAVFGAQCFHWFDLRATLSEIDRVCKQGSQCFAIWNDRADTPFNRDLEATIHRFNPGYKNLKRPESTIAELRTLLPNSEYIEFDHEQQLDLSSLIGRMASSSYVLHGVADKAAFNNELSRIFAKHQRDGSISMVFKTRVVMWRSSKPSRL